MLAPMISLLAVAYSPHSCVRGGLRSQNIALSTSKSSYELVAAPPTHDYVDTALAAAGAGVGVAVLTLMQHLLPLKIWTSGALQGVYVTTLCSSAIILNYAQVPPSFATVFWATFVPALTTVLLLRLTSSAIARPISVAITMVWFKLAGCAFPPAAALANTFLDNPNCTPMGWAYVTLPCTGNAILWVVAAAFSRVRARVKRGRSGSSVE